MTPDPDHVLDSIDHALRDYGVSADAMRWTPDAEKVAAEQERQPPLVFWELNEDSLRRAAEQVVAIFADVTVQITASVAPFMKSLGMAISRLGELAADLTHPVLATDRRHRIRCAACNPAGNPPPFPGGAEYHRRLKARQRRKRR